MKFEIKAILLIVLMPLLVYGRSFSNFFAQDDFILISTFSENTLLNDVKNTFGFPKVTHWRPFHNMFFLISGNLFGTNYQMYHIFNFFIHSGVGIMIYFVAKRLFDNRKLALFSGLIYTVHPAHFVTLYWISGSATSIGFLFLLISLYLFLLGKQLHTLVFYIIALFASEAMLAGLPIYLLIRIINKSRIKVTRLLYYLTGTSAIYLTAKILWLTPANTFSSYPVVIDERILSTFNFYISRIFGFSEAGNDFILSLLLILIISITLFSLFKNHRKNNVTNISLFSLILILVGMFPFIFLPNQLSGHYMNISVFGFSIILGLSLTKFRAHLSLIIMLIFLIISILNTQLISKNHWSVQRAEIASEYIESLRLTNPPRQSTLIFPDSEISSSYEAYISLGTGKAIDFYFGDIYSYCFTEFEKCDQ